jgi:hypothetical protein
VSDAPASSRHEGYIRRLSRYFTGKPCKHGHVAERTVSNSRCVECARQNIPSRSFERASGVGCELRKPGLWPDDGGASTEAVTDPNWLINGQPRVVRRVGWRPCMCCKRRFFSSHIAGIRLCEPCKDSTADKTAYGFD